MAKKKETTKRTYTKAEKILALIVCGAGIYFVLENR